MQRMNITHGKVDTINWHSRFAWLPQTFIADDGGFVTVWMESYRWRDLDCATEEIVLKDGRRAKNCHSH